MITKEGKVTAPYVLQPLSAPTLTYTSLEALRKWRFAPGRLNGEPVEVVFNMTINFKQ
ncbi:MAG: energy transducer TonB [Thermoanaerobaculia bacterium]